MMMHIPQALIAIHPVAEYLSWDPSPGAVGYYLLRSTSATGPFEKMNQVMIPQPAEGKVSFPLVGASGTMYYKVQSWDDNENMSESDAIPVTIK